MLHFNKINDFSILFRIVVNKMNTQTIYFNPPTSILYLQQSVGTTPYQVNTQYITSPSGVISNLNVENVQTARILEIIDYLYIHTGASITSNGDIYITTGTLISPDATISSLTVSSLVSNGNIIVTTGALISPYANINTVECNQFTGGVVSQINTSIQSYTNSADVYNECIPSVVSICIKSTTNSYYVGSGFITTGPNTNLYTYVLTAAHVILDPDAGGYPVCANIWVNISSPMNTMYKIISPHAIMGIDKHSDVALIRLNVPTSTYLIVKNSRTECKIGDVVQTIGFPGGIDMQSISRGIIRDNKAQFDSNVMESVVTDISIYGGNSGGPLITSDKKVLGIVSYGYTSTGEEINGGVASYLFAPIVSYFLINYTGTTLSYPKGYLGIQYRGVDVYIAAALNLSSVRGYYVQALDGTIVPTNFSVGDIIIGIEGVSVGIMDNQYPLYTETCLRTPGTIISVTYLPNGNYSTQLTKSVTLSVYNPANDYPLSPYTRHPVDKNII